MAETWPNDLNYGHPGVAAFDLGSAEWTFARRHATKQLKQINSWNSCVPTSTQVLSASIQPPTLQTSANATGAQKELRRLVRDYPQLAPASDLAPELALVSNAISSTTSVYDPLVGNLFSLGSITFGDKRDNPRRVAALPAGEARNVLCLVLMVKERHGWGFDKSIWLEAPSLMDGEIGYWNEEAAPIQQVYFSPSDDRSTFLAVRLPTRTVFFRPMYHQRHQPASRSPYYDIPSSVVGAHPILSLGIEQSGGAAHADVTFNPDFQFQCGIVDQQNTWSVWDIDYARKGSNYSISCFAQGRIAPAEELVQAGEDGWARILWVGDVNTLLVCNRRNLSVVNITGASYDYLPTPTLFARHSSKWILDVKGHPRYRSRFFVLTSDRLFLMAVTTSSQALDASAGKAGAVVLMSRRHYRGSEDFTLQLSVQMLTEDETGVLLYSCVNDFIQMYIFHQQASDADAFTSSFDPIVVKLTVGGPGHITQLHIEPLYFGERAQQGHNSGPGHSYMQDNFRFYRLFITLSDLSVHQVIVYAHDNEMDGPSQHETMVDDLMWSNVLHPRKELRAIRGYDEADGFATADGSKTTDILRSKISLQPLQWTEAQVHGSLQNARNDLSLYAALTRKDRGNEAMSESIDISVVTSQLKQMLVEDTETSSLPLGTLMEFAGSNVSVPDVDEASLQMQTLFSSGERQNRVDIHQAAFAHVLALTETVETTIATLYDNILQTWIGSLPPDVPIRVRQHKERLARRIAAEVMLAGTQIRHKGSTVESEPSQSHESGMTLPILPSMPLYRDQPQRPVSQSLSSMSPLSSQPQPSPLTLSFTSTMTPDPMSRLGKYLYIGHPSSQIPHNVNLLLAHWQPGADPYAYDWSATERTLEPETLAETSKEPHEKTRKRQERREKRQKRVDELMRARAINQPGVGVAPTMFPRSSPGPTFGSSQFALSSQVGTQNQMGFGGFGMVPQSQVEPGRFGGRPEKKKKKGKGRVSGF